MTTHRFRRRLAMTVLVAAAGTTGAQAAAASGVSTPPDDLLGCADQVFDPAGVTTDALVAKAAETATDLHANLHVRVERSLDGDIDGRERRLESACAGWLGGDGLRQPSLLVVMVSPTEHSTSI